MGLFEIFGDMFDPYKQNERQKARKEYFQRHSELLNALRQEQQRRAYRSANTRYGSNPTEWVDTIQRRKKIDFNKLHWKTQYRYNDVIVEDMVHVTGEDFLFISVPGVFKIQIPGNFIKSEMRPKLTIYSSNSSFHEQLVCELQNQNLIPLPLEELV